MRIALLVPTLEFGGVERVFVTLANGFSQRGEEVDLVAGLLGGPMKVGLDPNVRLFGLDSSRMMQSIPRLAKYLRTRKPDCLIAAMTHSTAAAATARIVARQKFGIVATEHNTMSKIVANTPGLKYRLMPEWARLALGSANAIVAVSAGVAKDLADHIRIPSGRIQVVYNPAITETLTQDAMETVEHPWFAPGEPPIILAVGRLDKQKDFSMLVRAFRLLKNRVRARLIILGEGPDRNQIEQTISDAELTQDVSLPGFEQNPYKFMKRAAVFASSSQWEGFGVALVEALSLGTNIVSTDCPHGPAEILGDGKFGTLVPVGNDEAMAHGLFDALKKPQQQFDICDHLQQFTAQHVISSYLSIMTNISGR